MKEYSELIDSFLKAASRAYARGIQTGSGGNISVRIPDKDQMIVKPSGLSLADCTRDNLIITDFKGNLIEGVGKPTREALLHGYIYQNVKTVGGILHCHAPWSISWSQRRQALPLVTYHAQLKIKKPIEVLNIETPVVTENDMPKVLALFSENPELMAFILAMHGIVAVAENVIDAEHTAELVEETAMINILTGMGTN